MNYSVRGETATMTAPSKHDEDREEAVAKAIEESVAAQEEAASTLRSVAHRLDEVSKTLRKHGAFPIADQIDREREKVIERANGYHD